MGAKGKTISAGIVLYRRTSETPRPGRSFIEVLLGHLGGPFWAKKDEGAWSFPKGVLDPAEEPFDGAVREFREELGFGVPGTPSLAAAIDLGVVAGSAKVIHLFAIESDVDPSAFEPGLFEMEWPPRSGRSASFPEIDRIAWTSLDMAELKLSAAQRPFVGRLRSQLA